MGGDSVGMTYQSEVTERNYDFPTNVAFDLRVKDVLIEYKYRYKPNEGRQLTNTNFKIDGDSGLGKDCTMYVYFEEGLKTPLHVVAVHRPTDTFRLNLTLPIDWYFEAESAARDSNIAVRAEVKNGVPKIEFGPTEKAVLLQEAP